MVAFMQLLVIMFAAEFLARRSRTEGVAPLDRVRQHAAVVCGALSVAVVVLFACQVWIVGSFISAQTPPAAWFASAPFKWILRESTAPGTLVFLLCAAQTLALGGFYLVARALPARTTLASAASAGFVMAVIALTARFINPDVLAYIGYGKLGLAQAYVPPGVSFGASFRLISDHWGTPMYASDYGPFFVLVQQVLVGWVPSLSVAVFVERLADVVLIALLGWLLWRRERNAAAAALCVMNPMLFFYDVVGAHNDLYGICLLLAAAYALRRQAWLSILAIAAAVSVKVVFAAFTLAVLADPRIALRKRMTVGIAGVALGLAACLALGGRHWIGAQLLVAHVQLASVPVTLFVLQRVLAAAALVALFVGFFLDRWLVTAAWLCTTFAPRLYPWYMTWAIPYAFGAGSAAGVLVALPFMANIMDPLFVIRYHAFALSVVAAVLATAGYLGWERIRLRRFAAEG